MYTFYILEKPRKKTLITWNIFLLDLVTDDQLASVFCNATKLGKVLIH